MTKLNDDGEQPRPDHTRIESSVAESRHEAGHAIAALVFGFTVTSIDIIPRVVPGTSGQLGKAGVDLQFPTMLAVAGRGEEAVFNILVILFSGYLAERKVNALAELEETHPQSDGARAYEYLRCAISKPAIDQYGCPKSVCDPNQFLNVWDRAVAAADSLVETHVEAITVLATLLDAERRLSGEKIIQCVLPLLGDR
jgi:hypothetical protein